MKNILLILIFLFCAKLLTAQINVTGYLNSSVGVGSNSSKTVYGEFRLYDIYNLDNFHAQVSIIYNLKQADNYKFGLGIGYEFINQIGDPCINLPLQLQFNPIKDNVNFSILIEGSPRLRYSANSFDIGFRPLIGFRYNF